VPENVKVIKPQDYTQEQWIQLKSDNEVIKQIVVCPESQRPFRILKQELDFYRKHNLDLPKFHPDVRHEQRTKLKPDRTLYLRTCDVCHAEMLTIYPQDYD
jgi:hypothetical protein